MDNTVEALYMAAAVLIFMLALSITLSSFSTFRNDLEDLILADERVDAATITDSSGKTAYINYISGENECRTVSIETVVNSMYRVYKENYTIIMKLNSYPDSYFKDNTGLLSEYKEKILQEAMSDQYYVKSGKRSSVPIISKDEKILKFNISNSDNNSEYIHKVFHDGLYDLLKDKKFTEYTGVYYQDDVGSSAEKKPTGVSDVNKREARIITYIEQ